MTNALVIEADLRDMLPNVRDQGPRPLCLAFAASDFNSANNKLSFELSVEYLAHHAYAREGKTDYQKGLTVESIIKTLHSEGQPREEQFPYNYSANVAPRKPPYDINPKHNINSVEFNLSIDLIEKCLDEGEVIVACISIPRTFQTISFPYILDNEVGEIGNHAVIIAGKAKGNCGSKFFLIRNSWGIDWGDDGHCWLSEKFLKTRTLALIEAVK